MFKKVPYGVKVRVRGNEQDGFIAEYTLHASRFTPFLADWRLISHYTHTPFTKYDTFPTFESAKEAAMAQYDSWINHYKNAEEKTRIAKSQSKVIWKHP